MRGRALAAALAAAGLLLLPLGLDPRGYAIRVATLALLSAAMGQAWNVVGGLANQMSLGHAAFFGIGAYTSTLLLIKTGLSPWIGMLAGAVLAGATALLLSIPTLRLKGHYFALATLAFGEVARLVAGTWESLTGGPAGISVPFAGDSLSAFQFKSTRPYYYIMLLALSAVSAVFAAVARSKLGYRLRAIRAHQDAAEVVGIATFRAKLSASVISAALTAALGTCYAQFNYFFDPETAFGVGPISIRMALIAIVGGIGTVWGPILGACFLVPAEEITNSLLAGRAAGASQLAYGVLLIAVILLEPRGLVALRFSRARFQRSGAAR
ncbi:MAG: branched-chain amino acid ABC transporter permease [Myxococcales bacterium]